MSTLLRSIVLAVALLFVITPNAQSTQVAHRSIEELGSDAPLVVRGAVSSVRSYWNEAHTRILTDVTVRVEERFKGAAPGEVHVIQMGGVVDGVRMTVAGSLEWMPGEDVVLFLEDSMPGAYRVAGFSQGKFFVERDPRSGEEFVVQASLGDVNLIGGDREALRAPLSLQRLLSRALPMMGEER